MIAEADGEKSFVNMAWSQGISKEEFGFIQENQRLNTLAESGYNFKPFNSDRFYSSVYPWTNHGVKNDRAYIFLQRPLYTPGETPDFLPQQQN